jgi:glycosyltransferase involved in cell wall biosynthesis
MRSHRPWIVGVAYSNLFYPEIDFWGAENLGRRQWRKLKDLLRRRAVLRADAWLFETDAIRQRGIDLFNLDPMRSIVVPPPVSPLLLEPRPAAASGEVVGSRQTVLLAAGWHPNKNLLMAVSAASHLKSIGRSFQFHFTLDPESEAGRTILEAATQLDVSDLVRCIGRVDPAEMGAVVRSSSVVMLISALESFSNNVIEAFACGVPLVISDRDWAHGACKDAAVFVEPTSAQSVAMGVLRAVADRDEYVRRGRVVLGHHYQTAEVRMSNVWQFIEEVSSIGVEGR